MKNNLEKELLDLFVKLEKEVDKDMKPLLLAYKKQLEIVKDEVFTIWGKYKIDGKMTITNDLKLNIMADIERKLIKTIKELGKQEEELTANLLSKMSKESYYRTAYNIDKHSNFGTTFSLLTKKMVNEVIFKEFKGEMFSDRIWKNKSKLVNSLKDIVEDAVLKGSDINKVARNISKEFGVSAFDSKRLIQTEMARVTAEAQDKIYKESNVVKKIQYVATLDGKTCDRCRDLDGKIFNKNEDYPTIPIHPKSRSRYIGVIDGHKYETRLDNETKENIDYKNYKEWYENKIENSKG